MSDERLIEFGCECGAEWCEARVEMTLSERDSVDHVGNRFAIAPGHPLFRGDRLIEKAARYWTVESDR